VNFVPNKFINIIFEKDKQNPDAMRKEIIAALDTFLLKDSGWTKTDDIDRDSYQNAIDWLGVSKRQNEKVIADYGNDQTKSQEIAYLQEGLNKYNNDIAYYQKKIAEIEYPIAMYKYNWKKMFGGMFDFASTISVTIIHDDERIIVAIRQMKNEQ
jgi:DNA mismatch repair ATPase MutS